MEKLLNELKELNAKIADCYTTMGAIIEDAKRIDQPFLEGKDPLAVLDEVEGNQEYIKNTDSNADRED